MSVAITDHSLGLTWSEEGGMMRAAHALRSDQGVWLVEPYESEAALQAAAALGSPAGVVQLLDRHKRDCQTISTRLGVPLLRLPDLAPQAPFEVLPILRRGHWQEIALWWPSHNALIVAEAVGTAPAFALGRRAGAHPLLRATGPPASLTSHRPEMLLVGHGRAIDSGAAAALDEALLHWRSDLPRLLIKLPSLLLGAR